ncbi:DUF1240 domain-containing protein [Enterobacter cancerogenus]|uniref:DUF1240 domain-containing protein n=1 Tax=Enterobacter cancerogenus TaxID=69218 RepID=UPI000C77FA1A|nr:DUF1240 domain-containing protein [Enterobacter cancerogenus]AUJ80831.1 hypothetical protein CWI88_07135 [Enterobacter cancerogenus]
MFEEKIRPFLAIVIILGLCVLSIYLGNSIFQSYFSFEGSIIFSWLSIALIALPVVMIFPLVYFILMIVKGKDFAFKTMDNYVSYLKWSCIAIVILGLLFSCLYPKELLSKGYVRCNGVPSGWMAGTATRYVKDPSICVIN